MQIIPHYPKHPLLKQYIDYYYFLKTDPDFRSVYYAYPHINHALNIHKNVDCVIEEMFTKVFSTGKSSNLAITQGQYNAPFLIELSGSLDKVTIVFKPLGLIQFTHGSLDHIDRHHSRIFTTWNNDPQYYNFVNDFYSTADIEVRSDLLESYLVHQYQPLPQNEILLSVIEKLQDFDHSQSFKQISEGVYMTEKSLNRLFNKYIGINPSSFRKVARFRHSLRNKILKERFENLTAIGYQSNFYDQSYFNKIYKQFTQENPSSFFKKIDQLADNNLIWKLVNKM